MVPNLKPAAEIAQKNRCRQLNESDEYRNAREALLVEEIELNRHIARVAAQRRALPPGGEVKGDYQFISEASSVKGANPVGFEALFGDKDTLFVYNWMYGPKRQRPCSPSTAICRWVGVSSRRAMRSRGSIECRGSSVSMICPSGRFPVSSCAGAIVGRAS